MPKIRAKSVIKINTSTINLDYTYVKGTALKSVVLDLLSMLINYCGKADVKKMLDDKLAKYEDEEKD